MLYRFTQKATRVYFDYDDNGNDNNADSGGSVCVCLKE